MRAAVYEQFATPLSIQNVPDPTPTENGVVIQVKACGVNFPDVLIIEDKYQFKPPRPFSPGGEVAGVVKSVGEGVTKLKVGDRITLVGDIFPLNLDLTIRGLLEMPQDDSVLYFHWKYLEESIPLARRSVISTFSILADSIDDSPRVAKAVDEMFRNSPFETKTESEQAFVIGYALFQIPSGTLVEYFGHRKIVPLSLAWWSVFTAMTAAC